MQIASQLPDGLEDALAVLAYAKEIIEHVYSDGDGGGARLTNVLTLVPSREAEYMMARLGNVIYWIACGLAVLVFLYFLRAFGFDDGSTQDKVLAFIAAGIVALIV